MDAGGRRSTHCREVGKALAALHLAGADFPLRARTRWRIDGWRKLWDAPAPVPTRSSKGLPRRSSGFRFRRAHWPAGLPSGIIHADLFPDNVFFLGDRLSGLIDFYFACNDSTPTTSPPASTPGASRRTMPST